MRIGIILSVGLLIFVGYAAVALGENALSENAQAECRPWSAVDIPEAGSLVIGNINIEAENVFDNSDPEEQRFIHRATNRLHKITSENVIRRQILVKSGDNYTDEKLRESERLLRKNRYLGKVKIEPTERCGGIVNLQVVTLDSWSFVPGLSFSRAGGVNKSAFAFKESNLLGLGKLVEIKLKKGVDRRETSLRYTDPQLFGTRKTLALRLQNNSDGKSEFLKLEKPFYSRDTKFAWGLTLKGDQRVDALYLNGAIDREINIDSQSVDAYAGRSFIATDTAVWQMRLGIEWAVNSFEPVNGFDPSVSFTDRNYSMPYIDVSRSNERFIQHTNLRTMESVEDISIGALWHTRLGISNKAFGASDNLLVYDTGVSFSHLLGKSTLGLYTASYSGEYGSAVNSNAELSLDGEWFITQSKRTKLYFTAGVVLSENLYNEHQLVIGGDTGLRGYPIRFQSGENRFNVTVEQRWYYDWYPWRMARLGAAVFAEAGTAWGGLDDGADQQLLRNVGFGLRLIPTRQSQNKVMHLDVAFPLDNTADISSVQIILKSKRDI